jgi:hypothetical protein
MEIQFEIYNRKFKLIGDELHSYYKKGVSNIPRWYIVRMTAHKTIAFKVDGKIKTLRYKEVIHYAHNQDTEFKEAPKDSSRDTSLLRKKKPYKGYGYDRTRRRYIAKIIINDKYVYLGSFVKEEDALRAHLDAKEKYNK